MFGLIVLGSVVRTTGSGLACPDWPLCQGRILPPLEFHVLIEWSHRAVALLVSVLLISTVGFVLWRRETRARLGGIAGLAVGLLLVQILLGALTVWKLLHPSVVNTHLAVGLLLFGTITFLAAEAAARAGGEPTLANASRPGGLLPLLALATALTYAQAVLGGTVSSQHAGLACPGWPDCNGEWMPPLPTLAGIQMLHRYVAYLLLLVMAVTAFAARGTSDGGVRAGAKLASSLTGAQIVLGVCNVLIGTPAWLSGLHLAVAAAILGTMVLATHRAARLPAREAGESRIEAAAEAGRDEALAAEAFAPSRMSS